MCYQKRFWQIHRFPAKNYAEDNALVYTARDEKQLIAVGCKAVDDCAIPRLLYNQPGKLETEHMARSAEGKPAAGIL